MKKFLDAFNNLDDRARYGALAGVVVLLLALDVFFLSLPQIGGIADINGQIKTLSDDTQEVITARQQISRLKKNLVDQRAQWVSLSAKVRPLQEVPAILSSISGIADEYGVKIDQLLPEKDRQAALTSSKEAGKYYALPIVIKARGGYHKFGHFLNKLEGQDLCFILENFIVQNDDKDPNIQSFSLTIQLILKGDKS